MKNLFHNFFLPQKQNEKFSQNLIAEIVHKVKYNIPQINFNQNLLSHFLIKIKKPIFVVEEDEVNLCYAKSLFLANLICNFEIAVMCKDSKFCKQQYYKFLPNATFLQKGNLTKQQKEILYNLNINIPCQKFEISTQNEIIVNNKKINKYIFNNFCLENKLNNAINIKQYYFNGNYYFYKNKLKNNKILIKKILFSNKYNYFILNKSKIINLSNYEIIYILSNTKIKIKLFKNKNCDFVLSISANTNKDFVVYIGKEKINICDKNLEQKLQVLLQQQFANKIHSSNKKLDNFFNNILPQKIVKSKIAREENNNFEKQYFLIKNKVVSIKNNNVCFYKNFCQNFEYNFFGKTKKINFINNNNKKIVVNGAEYQNCDSISLEVFKKFDNFEICY